MNDLISRQAAIDTVHNEFDDCIVWDESGMTTANEVERILDSVPSAQPERYTKEELKIFLHGLSLRLLSLRSAQHWQEDDKTAKEIEFLAHLYEKVEVDMKN